jgi:hypothetical protein
LWNQDQLEIQRLQNLIIFSWDNDTKRKTIDALASYKKSALPSLTYLASVLWDKELREYVLDKIQQINSNTI